MENNFKEKKLRL